MSQPVVAGEMKSGESATLSRDLQSGQRLKFVRSGTMVTATKKMKNEDIKWQQQLINLRWLLPVVERGRPVSREDEEALRHNGIENNKLWLKKPGESLLPQLLIADT